MAYQEVFEYEIKFVYSRGGDKKYKKFVAADSEEDAKAGVEMIIRKLFKNGVVTSQNLERIDAEPKTDGDWELLSFGKFEYELSKIKEFFTE